MASEGEVRARQGFAKLPKLVEVPDLVGIQRRSYEQFLQRETPPDARAPVGLQRAFASVFPVASFSGHAQLEFVSYALDPPRFDPDECRDRGLTYAAPVRVTFRLVVFDTPEGGPPTLRDVKEQEVFLGEVPLMTDSGTFVINGAERVVVSQLHRSPGVFFHHDQGRTHASGRIIYGARLVPDRGAWLDFEIDQKDLLQLRIDRRRKMPATILLRALGLSTEELLQYFYDRETISLEPDGRLFRSIDYDALPWRRATRDLRHPVTGELLVRRNRRLSKVAIRKLREAQVERLPVERADVLGAVSARDVVDEETGEVVIGCNEPITEPILDELRARGLRRIEVLVIDEVNVGPTLRNTVIADGLETIEEAQRELYRRMRPGEAPSVETARRHLEQLLFTPSRYDLTAVGRLKLNHKLKLDEPLTTTVLTRRDILETVRYLLDLKDGRGTVDDVDHLGNRRVRAVGELVERQYRIGLARMERAVRERMSLSQEIETLMPHDLVNPRVVMAAVNEYFGSSQLSQFMDQTNPLSEVTHKRRLSALGPGGLTREYAGFEVRDVHATHYGRLCPVETPEGPNVGLIVSLSTYARVDPHGFLESPYRKVADGRASDEVVYLSALEEEGHTIAQASTPLAPDGRLPDDLVACRRDGDFVMARAEEVTLMDAAPAQLVSVAASLIPFLEHDDANRALMGANMQRQAVPLLRPQAPIVGTGMEGAVARDSGAVMLARREGTVERADGTTIVVRPRGGEDPHPDIYRLRKFRRSNQSSCINQRPLVHSGQRVRPGDVIADGPATDRGELALGANVLVAFMPWGGYNFEDAILLSERLVAEDVFTSVHVEEFEAVARDTKLGPEEVTRDIPNVGEEALRDLDESGIVRIGADVETGDILVGKVSPKGETQLTPEEKLLRAIFGQKALDVRDSSLRVPPGVRGVVIGARILTRRGTEKDEHAARLEAEERERLVGEEREEKRLVAEAFDARLAAIGTGRGQAAEVERDALEEQKRAALAAIEERTRDRITRLRRGDDLPAGVLKSVRVYVALKRKLAVGDKMAGRHGNKGVVSRILPVEDMPHLPDGTPVDVVLNPLGVPSRMNVGQILETHLGRAAGALGRLVASPVFDGASEEEIKALLSEAGLEPRGQTPLVDGRTGEPFENPVTVGVMYMLKLHHLVDDKIHARSIGPYSLITQQPLGGKAQFGGQRLGEMEVWALEAYGAAYGLQEFLTVKSDDVLGRARTYEAIVQGKPHFDFGLPESFHVLVKELQALCLDVELLPLDAREAAE